MTSQRALSYAVVATLSIAMSGCQGYVKRAEFDSTIAELRAADQKQQSQIDALTQEMHQKFADYDTRITQAEGRIRVDAVSHFAFNDASLRDEDKPLLDDFAKVISTRFPQSMVTVEGFADAAGSKRYNLNLGEKRASAVRQYLVDNGHLTADQVRAVSYGEAANRQVVKGKWGDGAEANRRVTLVVDFPGALAAR